MILLYIGNTTAFDNHDKMKPNTDGELPRMARSVHWRGTKPVRKGNESLRILADARDIPDDVIPGLVKIYTLEQALGYRTPGLYEDGTKILDDNGEVQMVVVPPEDEASAVFKRIYPRTPYTVTPEEGDSYEVVPPPLFGVIAGHNTEHLLLA